MYTADFTPVRADRTSSDGAGALKPRAVPPHNGFGSDDDSLGNCLSLMPKPPRRDFARFMQLDSCALESHVLRFLAKLHLSSAPAAYDGDDDGGGTRLDLSSGPAADPSGTAAERRFIICFHLADGTVSVFEQSSRNAGTKLPSVAKCLEWYLRTSDLK